MRWCCCLIAFSRPSSCSLAGAGRRCLLLAGAESTPRRSLRRSRRPLHRLRRRPPPLGGGRGRPAAAGLSRGMRHTVSQSNPASTRPCSARARPRLRRADPDPVSSTHPIDALALRALFAVAVGVWRLITARQPGHRRDGAWIALVGLWLLVNTLELFGLFWHNSWPLMMILVGLLHIVWPKDKDERVGGVVLLAVGSWLLLTVTHTFGLDWRTAWPMLMVIAGVACVVKALMRALPALMGTAHDKPAHCPDGGFPRRSSPLLPAAVAPGCGLGSLHPQTSASSTPATAAYGRCCWCARRGLLIPPASRRAGGWRLWMGSAAPALDRLAICRCGSGTSGPSAWWRSAACW